MNVQLNIQNVENVSMKYVSTDKGTVIRDGEEVKGLDSNPVVIPKKKQF